MIFNFILVYLIILCLKSLSFNIKVSVFDANYEMLQIKDTKP